MRGAPSQGPSSTARRAPITAKRRSRSSVDTSALLGRASPGDGSPGGRRTAPPSTSAAGGGRRRVGALVYCCQLSEPLAHPSSLDLRPTWRGAGARSLAVVHRKHVGVIDPSELSLSGGASVEYVCNVLTASLLVLGTKKGGPPGPPSPGPAACHPRG